MKSKIVGISFVFFFFVGFVFAHASGERIISFDAVVEINQDASILVEETIVYDFNTESRRGIFRELPSSYLFEENGDSFVRTLEYELESVQRNGVWEPYLADDGEDVFSIRIGNESVFISGQQEYTIVYRVQGALNYFDTFDELYWNVIGGEWSVPIQKASATVFSFMSDFSIIQDSCYVGYLNQNTPCLDTVESAPLFEVSEEGEDHFVFEGELKNIETDEVLYDVQNKSRTYYAQDISPQQYLTFAVGFPKQLVEEVMFVSSVTQNKSFIRTIVNIILFPLLPLFVFLWLWKRKKAQSRVLVTEFNPPEGVSPMGSSFVLGKPRVNFLVAQILYLAQKGILKIVIKNASKKKQDFEFHLVDSSRIVNQEDKNLAHIVFGADIRDGVTATKSDIESRSNLNRTHYEYLTQGLAVRAKEQGYFEKNSVQGVSRALGVGALSLGLGALLKIWGVALSGIIILFFATSFRKLTPKGRDIKNHLLGYKKYLSVAEKDRIKFHAAPQKNPELFFEHLPFAVAFGVEKQWMKYFQGLELISPHWISGDGVSLNQVNLASQLVTSLSLSVASSIHKESSGSGFSSQSSGSSGGGFSGGGAGGGGGGSW